VFGRGLCVDVLAVCAMVEMGGGVGVRVYSTRCLCVSDGLVVSVGAVLKDDIGGLACGNFSDL